VAKKMSRWDRITKKERDPIDYRAFIEATPEAGRKRIKKRAKVSDTEILSIVYRVLVEKEHVSGVAQAFRVSNTRVNSLVKKVREDVDVLRLMKERHEERRNREAIIR